MSQFRDLRILFGGCLIAAACACCSDPDGQKETGSKTSDGGSIGTDEESDTGTGSEKTDAPAVALVIDDFEDGDHVSLTGGAWFVYDDGVNEGRSTITISRDTDGNLIMDGEGYESQSALSLGYSLDQGDWVWEPYIGWAVTMGEEDAPYDASAYSGLTYTYKGSSHFVYVYTFDVTNYDYYRAYLPDSDDWRVVSLRFSEFSQGGWDGISVPFNLDNVGHIGWEYKGATGDTGTVLLDNVAFLGDEAVEEDTGEEREPDLTIREPDPPEDDTIESIDISNPVQELVYRVLDKGYTFSNWLEAAKFESYEFDEDYIGLLAANGFRSVRLPIDLDFYIENRRDYFSGDAPFAVEDRLFDILDQYERWTAAAGLALVIDYHQYDQSLDLSDPVSVEAAVQLWTAVAAHFADNPREDLFFELLNEPELSCGVDAVAPSDWTDVASQMIDGIRSVDTTHVILVGDVEWNGIGPLVERTPFEDEKIAYVFHYYEPFIFTHQGTSSTGMHSTHDIPYPYSKDRWSEYSSDFGFGPDQADWQFQQLESYYQIGTKSWMRNKLIEVKRWAVEHDVPVVCTEFGVNPGAGAEDTVNFYTDLADVFEELEIPWQLWFKIMDSAGDIDPGIRSALHLN